MTLSHDATTLSLIDTLINPTLEELENALEAYTVDGGNLLAGSHVLEHEIVDGEILVTLENGLSFAIRVDTL